MRSLAVIATVAFLPTAAMAAPLQVAAEDCGALGDVRRLTDVELGTGDRELASAQVSFQAADVGKLVYINGADPTGRGVLKTAIVSVAGGRAVLADAAAHEAHGAMAFYGHDSTEAVLECQAKADEIGAPLVFSGGGYGRGAYLIRRPLVLRAAAILGQGASVNGNAPQTYLIFAELGAKPALATVQGVTLQPIRLENFTVQPVGWDQVTASAGDGLDLEYRVLMRNVQVFGFAGSCVFAHQSKGRNGPYGSRFEASGFSHCGRHGFLVGTGANSITLDRDDFKYNGAPAYGREPTARGHGDGLYVSDMGDGNAGGTYPRYVIQDLTILGGDASYNSRYGWNFDELRDSDVNPGYAELNLGDGSAGKPKQARIGSAPHVRIEFNVLEPAALVYGTPRPAH